MAKGRVIAIGLDSAEPSVIEKWMSEGLLPNLTRIRDEGVYATLDNFEESSVETAWTTFATGCSPTRTGYYAPLSYDPNEYAMVTKAAYDYREYPPFYALGDDYKVIAFDVPQVRLHEGVNGIQVAAWGAHSPQVEQGSRPARMIDEIHHKFGVHPSLHRDYACVGNFKETLELQERLRIGIERRKNIAIDLVKNNDWDLFITVFGEAHAAMHTCWHLSQPEHPLYEHFKERLNGRDPMLEAFQAMDSAIGDIRAACGGDVSFLVFSLHGMGPAFMDLSTLLFIPEYLYRHQFPGSIGIGGEPDMADDPAPVLDYDFGWWERHVWNTVYERNPLKKLARRTLHNRLYKLLTPLIDPVRPDKLVSPIQLRSRVCGLNWAPGHWYKNFWPRMKAIALPSFGEGYVRINVKGRDPHGVVEPEDYDAVCDEVSELLMDIVDVRDRQPIVDRVLRLQDEPMSQEPNSHFADLVVLLKDKTPPDVVEHARYGRLGPYPRYRSGTHRHRGFLLGSGAAINRNASVLQGHAMDVAPTILKLLGAAVPGHMEGRPLTYATGEISESAA